MSSVKIAYAKPQTLVTGSPLLAKGTIGDVQASQLTFWVGVPLVFERVRSSIQNAIRDKSPLAASVYDFAYEYKKRWSRRGFKCRLTDAVLFRPIREKFSKRLKLVLTGGAPLTSESSVFIKQFLGVDLTLVYAATECSATCLSSFNKFDDGNTVSGLLYPINSIVIYINRLIQIGTLCLARLTRWHQTATRRLVRRRLHAEG